jgi:RNA polymerase sigma factor (sigma-70 family)
MQTKMTSAYQDFIPTRRSLLGRLKDLGDEQSWKDFFDTYWKLIYSVAVKSGLRDPEAQDVVQETIISVAKTIGKYRHDPSVTFKGWLHHLVRRRVADHFRKKRRRELLLDDTSIADTGNGSLLDQVADPASQLLDAVWEEEWQRNLVEAALEKLKTQISVKQYQVFYLNVIKGQPVKDVAASMNVGSAYVHLARHRTQPLFRKAVQQIEINEP